jgi:3-O-methylgallate 3,4-dioxygenase
MAEIVLGVGTSHSPMLSVPPELWEEYAQEDYNRTLLVYPPEGVRLTATEAIDFVSPEIRDKPRGLETFVEQHARCHAALQKLAAQCAEADPDVVVIISDDQSEWFFENLIPPFYIFWGDSIPIIPRPPDPRYREEIGRYVSAGYGDKAMDLPVASGLGRHLIEHFGRNGFDIASATELQEQYGGRATARYPDTEGEIEITYDQQPRPYGIPHGYSFIIKYLFGNRPTTILPIFQNTFFPPNTISPRRTYDFGAELARGIAGWDSDAKVAIVASGGLSHFVTDEELDTRMLDALSAKDEQTLCTLPQHLLLGGTSEILNWVTAGGVFQDTGFAFDLIDYVPVYRTEFGTGGGWAFGRWT